MKIDFTQEEIDLPRKCVAAQVTVASWAQIVCGIEYSVIADGIEALEELDKKLRKRRRVRKEDGLPTG